jgi:hypothetical protein
MRGSIPIAREGIRRRISDQGSFPPQEFNPAVGDLAFEVTCKRNLLGERPGRRNEQKTKRPGGRYMTRKPGQTSRLTPLTRVVFWLMPVPTLTYFALKKSWQ